MKKTFLCSTLLLVMASVGLAQTKINKSFDVSSFDKLELLLEYPELIQIKVWKGKEVKIEGTVDIQNGQFDNDFQISSRSENGKLIIQSSIKDLKKNSEKYSVHSGNDEREDRSITISDKGTTVQVGGKKKSKYVNGIKVSIKLVVTIPEDMKVMLDARYGLVEVLGSPISLEIDARYGGVDVTVDERQLIELAARTQWGQIYTNLEIPVKMGGDDGMGKWMKAETSVKRGDNRLSVTSQYGNVYLRKN